MLPVRRSLLCFLLLGFPPAVADDIFKILRDGGLRDGGSGDVVGIVDGDTVFFADGREVRLVGLQAPKLPLGRKNFAKWPLADHSKAALSDLVFNKTVRLGYGGREVDRHGRQLAHLFLNMAGGQILWVQGRMLEIGLARTYTFRDNRALIRQMYEKEALARDSRRGIWRLPYYQVRQVADIASDIGSFQLVEGVPIRVATVRKKVFINYGQDWRSDFTILVRPKARQLFERLAVPYGDFAGKRLRVRGWIKSWNGPLIEVTHPEQIQILD